MAKSSRSRQRQAKALFANGGYYPKVDLSDLEGRLPSSWSPSSVVTPAEQAADPEPVAATLAVCVEEPVMPPPVANPEPPIAAAPPRPAPAASAPPLQPAPAAVAVASKGDADAVLRLPASLDLPAARPLAAALLARRGRPIVIDASAVGQLGAQCIQVLLSARRTWEADGVPLSIVDCAPRMIEDLKLIGINRTFATGDLAK